MYTPLTIFAIAFAVSCAEPPRYNPTQSQRAEAAPYPYSGWRPSGPEFRLPEPHRIYGPPPQEYGPPPQEYGPPPSEEYGSPDEPPTTTVEPEATTTELPTTTESNDLEAKDLGSGDADLQSEKLKNADEGVYYVYHPSGLLQRVVYATQDDVEKMAFSAKLKYENVEPIKGPIFTYDPKTYVFKRL
ncbi:extensin-2-like [Anoplophora glabripennis]|uniref:extensin-2-like n=1 Tax=Anoplophora glabripennis TaxID=217634 RepID=UPI000873B311|nr:extensin-2-like [Anoplophora glabripennis]